MLVHILVLDDQRLLLFVDNADLIHQELCSRPLVVLALLPCQPLVGLEKFALSLVDDLLELLPMPLQLHLVALCFLLEVEVLLQQLVPSALALALALVHFLDYPPVLDVLCRQVLQQLSENGLLL